MLSKSKRMTGRFIHSLDLCEMLTMYQILEIQQNTTDKNLYPLWSWHLRGDVPRLEKGYHIRPNYCALRPRVPQKNLLGLRPWLSALHSQTLLLRVSRLRADEGPCLLIWQHALTQVSSSSLGAISAQSTTSAPSQQTVQANIYLYTCSQVFYTDTAIGTHGLLDDKKEDRQGPEPGK